MKSAMNTRNFSRLLRYLAKILWQELNYLNPVPCVTFLHSGRGELAQ